MGAGASAQLSDAQQKEMLEHMREQFRAKCEAMGVDVGQISDADIDAQLRELRKENAALAQKVEEKQQGGGSGVPADVEKLMHEAAWPAIVNDIMECLSIMLLSNDDALFSTTFDRVARDLDNVIDSLRSFTVAVLSDIQLRTLHAIVGKETFTPDKAEAEAGPTFARLCKYVILCVCGPNSSTPQKRRSTVSLQQLMTMKKERVAPSVATVPEGKEEQAEAATTDHHVSLLPLCVCVCVRCSRHCDDSATCRSAPSTAVSTHTELTSPSYILCLIPPRAHVMTRNLSLPALGDTATTTTTTTTTQQEDIVRWSLVAKMPPVVETVMQCVSTLLMSQDDALYSVTFDRLAHDFDGTVAALQSASLSNLLQAQRDMVLASCKNGLFTPNHAHDQGGPSFEVLCREVRACAARCQSGAVTHAQAKVDAVEDGAAKHLAQLSMMAKLPPAVDLVAQATALVLKVDDDAFHSATMDRLVADHGSVLADVEAAKPATELAEAQLTQLRAVVANELFQPDTAHAQGGAVVASLCKAIKAAMLEDGR